MSDFINKYSNHHACDSSLALFLLPGPADPISECIVSVCERKVLLCMHRYLYDPLINVPHSKASFPHTRTPLNKHVCASVCTNTRPSLNKDTHTELGEKGVNLGKKVFSRGQLGKMVVPWCRLGNIVVPPRNLVKFVVPWCEIR